MESVKEDENSVNKGEVKEATETVDNAEPTRAPSPSDKSNESGGHRHVRVAMFVEDDKDKEKNRDVQDSKNKDLAVENKVLQKRLLAIRKRRSTIGTKLFLDGADTQYQIALKQWMEAKQELDTIMDEYNDKIDRMQDLVSDKQEEAHILHQEFSERKWQHRLLEKQDIFFQEKSCLLLSLTS